MSTHAKPETRAESSVEPDHNSGPAAEPAVRPDRESDPVGEPRDPFETHNSAATFGASERRLPNTVDRENKYVG